MAATNDAPVVWKHIGLHGHSVGTFTADPKAIQWKSALTGSDVVDVSTSRIIPAQSIKGAQWTVFGRSGHLRLQTNGDKQELRFDGFPPTDFDALRATLRDKYQIELKKHNMSSSGTSFGNVDIKGRNMVFRHCILEDADEEGEEFEPRDGDEMMSLDLTEVSQCVLPGNNRNEIELQFPESDTVEAGTDQCVAIRFYIPPDADADPTDRTAPSAAELFQQRIMKTANIKNTTGDVIVEFDESKGTFLTPRGRYAIELYDVFLRMRGAKYDYKIKYDDISRLFLLPKPDEVHMAFVIALDKPIRQGQQRYQYLVLQTTKEQSEVAVNLDEKTLEKEYNGDLQPVMHGSLSNLVAKTFKIITKKKVFIPGKFANANQQACVKCALRANEGHLYPLEKQFVFIHKPPVLIRFDEVESVEFQRYAGGQGSTRNFDLCVTLRASASGAGGPKEYIFSGIDRSDYAGLYNFLSGKRIRIKNLQEADLVDDRPQQPVYNEDEIYGGVGGIEDESEDEDYDVNEPSEGEGGSGSDENFDSADDDELGSDIDASDDSDLEEARHAAGVPKKKKKKKKTASKKKKRPAHDDDDDDGDDEDASPKKKSKKAKKDPNAPKRPMSSFLIFANANRSKIKEKNSGASFGEVQKLASAEFKSLDEEGKKEWEDLAAKDKQRYTEEMKNYTPSKEFETKGGKKKKGKKKDPNAPKRAVTAFMYFSIEMRPKFKEENPDISFGDMGKLVGKKYKELTEEEREKYDDMAKADKERYKKEMAEYKEKEKAKGDEAKSEPDDDSSEEEADEDSDDDSD